MSSINIHPTAIVSKKAKIGNATLVGPFTIIEDDVIIGNDCEIRSHVHIANGARIGNEVKIYTGTVIATEPQDLKYEGEATYAYVGDRTLLREYVTVNRGTVETGKTVVGADCLIMAYAHVAHDCRVGDKVIMSNVTQLGGHVTVQDWVIFGGVVKVHQFCRVGKHSMIGADCKLVKDVPPFTLIGRQPARVEGINKIGLRRRGFSHELISEIQKFYDVLLYSGLNTTDGLSKYMERNSIPDEIQDSINFIKESKRGIHR